MNGKSLFFGKGIEQYRFRGKRLMHLSNARFAGGGGAPTAEPETDEEKALLKKIETRMTEALAKRGIVDKETLDLAMKPYKEMDPEAIRKALADMKEMNETIKRNAEEIEKIQNAAVSQVKEMNVRAQVEAWVKANKKDIDAVRSGNKENGLKPLEIRVAATMLKSSNLGGSAYLPKPEFEQGFNDLVRVQPTFWNFISKGRTSSAAYVWVNKKNPDGAAAFIGEGVAKPPIDFELATEISNAKKIAESLKASTEILEDIDGMTTMIEDELRFKLMDKLNTTLMTGVLSSTVPAGIQTVSVTYTLTGVTTADPNNMDAIRAVVAQLRVGNFSPSLPVTVFINPVDAANMDMQKAVTSGVYLLPPFSTANGKTIAGATIVEDNNVPAGYFQAAILSYFRVLIYKDFTISWGWENDDFTKNLVTVIAEMRLHSFHSENYNGAFIYDTFANVKTAITA